MAERSEREILNYLIGLCRDAERGFVLAADEALTPELRQKFLDLAEQRRRFAVDLLPHAHRLGGPAGTDGTATAALHRAWMQCKARLARDRDHAILSEAERGERFALAAYDDAVNDILPPGARDLVEAQDENLRNTVFDLLSELRREG